MTSFTFKRLSDTSWELESLVVLKNETVDVRDILMTLAERREWHDPFLTKLLLCLHS